jgi:hypothetical protein
MSDPNELFRAARVGTPLPSCAPDVVGLYRRARTGDREAARQFHRLIGYRPWMTSPLDIDPHGPPPPWIAAADRPDYDRMRELRQQLDEATAS